MRRLVYTVTLLLVTGLLLAACGGDDSGDVGEATLQQLSVEMNDIYFGDQPDNVENPPVWTVSAGNDVNVSAVNQGVLEHNWAVIEEGATLPDQITNADEIAEDILFNVGVVDGGETANGRFSAPAPGNYLVICTVAGHYPQMQGRLLVTE